MKIICTNKISGKRIAVSTASCPNYKEEYNDENGNAFVKAAPKKVVVKPKKVATKKKATKRTVKKTK